MGGGALRILAGGGALAAALLVAPGAPAEVRPVTFVTTLTDGQLSWPDGHVTYVVKMEVGPRPVHVTLTASGHRWPDRHVSGSPVVSRLTGLDGVPGPVGHYVADVALTPGTCLRGDFAGLEGDSFDLPAGATATATYVAHLTAPPWPHTSYGPGLVAHVEPAGGEEAKVHVPAPKPEVAGPRGVHIRLHARRRGHRYRIRGRTAPAVRHGRIRVRWQTPDGRHHRIQTVRTNRHGRFRLRRWRPPRRRGPFQIVARYVHPAHGLVADRSCDLTIRARRGR